MGRSVAPDDAGLVEGLRAQDPDALQEVANSYGGLLFNLAQRITGSTSDADDVVQETLLRAWGSLPASGPVHLRAWLCTVATRLALNELRRRRRHPVTRLPADGRADATQHLPPGALAEPRPGYDPYKAAAAHLSEADTLRALASLPGTLRAALVLRALHGLDYAEIAGALGCSVGAARVKVHRARQHCARALLGAEPEPPERAACARVAERVLAWTEGELSPGQAAEVEAHVASCSYCQRARERAETAKSAWGLLPLLAWKGNGRPVGLELARAGSTTGPSRLGPSQLRRARLRRALMGERDRHVLRALLATATAGVALGALLAALQPSKPGPSRATAPAGHQAPTRALARAAVRPPGARAAAATRAPGAATTTPAMSTPATSTPATSTPATSTSPPTTTPAPPSPRATTVGAATPAAPLSVGPPAPNGPWKAVASPTKDNLYAVSCVPVASRVYCYGVGAGGSIERSFGNGGNWVAQPSPTRASLRGIACVASLSARPLPLACFAAGDDGTLLASQGGGPWRRATPSPLTSYPFSAVACQAGGSRCWAVGTAVAAEYDPRAFGGDGWRLITVLGPAGSECGPGGPENACLRSVALGNTDEHFAVGGGGNIYQQFDYRGQGWSNSVSLGAGYFTSISCGPPAAAGHSHCVAVGTDSSLSASRIYVTFDSGANWSPARAPAEGALPPLRSVSVPPGAGAHGLAWAVGDQGTIIASDDGGLNWVKESSPTAADLEAVDCPATALAPGARLWCVAVGQGGTILELP